MPDPRPGKTRERLLFLLKTKGPQTASELARRVELTSMAVRQHLGTLESEGLVAAHDERRAVGRPAHIWSLTEAGSQRFPEGYAELAVDLIGTVRRALGEEALEALISDRTSRQLAGYRERIPEGAPLPKKVAALAKLRREEGYMAEWSRGRDGSLTLVENHCPICAAAQVCQGLCDAELHLFREALGPGVDVARQEHILEGSRRCVYHISPIS